MFVVNPWINYETNYRVFSNTLTTSAGKEFKSVGVKMGADYEVTQRRWVASVQKNISEKVAAKVSSYQSEKEMAFTHNTNRVFEVVFSQGW